MRPGIILLKAFLVIWIIFAFSLRAWGEVNPEPVRGRAPVEDDKVAAARANALEDAFQNKVKEEVAQILPPSVLEMESQSLEEKIYTRSREFISRYSIVKEYRDQEEYVIEARISLSDETLRKALLSQGFLEKKHVGPIFLVVLENCQGKYSTWWASPAGTAGQPSVAEAYLAKRLKDQGYTLIEPIPSQARPDQGKLIAHPCETDTLRQIAEISGAGICICACAKSVPVERKADTRAIVSEARIDLSLINLESQESLARFSAQARAEADTVQNADSLALEEVARSILPELLGRLEEYRPETRTADQDQLEVTISSLYSYKLYKTMHQTLARVPGVGSLELWGFSPGKVRFLVQYQGEPLAFANSLARKDFGEFQLAIVKLDKNQIELRVTPVRYRGPRP
jgi:hypothetical protein